jgi:hypothetical protein
MTLQEYEKEHDLYAWGVQRTAQDLQDAQRDQSAARVAAKSSSPEERTALEQNLQAADARLTHAREAYADAHKALMAFEKKHPDLQQQAQQQTENDKNREKPEEEEQGKGGILRAIGNSPTAQVLAKGVEFINTAAAIVFNAQIEAAKLDHQINPQHGPPAIERQVDLKELSAAVQAGQFSHPQREVAYAAPQQPADSRDTRDLEKFEVESAEEQAQKNRKEVRDALAVGQSEHQPTARGGRAQDQRPSQDMELVEFPDRPSAADPSRKEEEAKTDGGSIRR